MGKREIREWSYRCYFYEGILGGCLDKSVEH